MINYIRGDIFDFIKDKENIILPHVVNNKGGFASGFVIPLTKHFPKAKESYMEWFNNRNTDIGLENRLLLGNVNFVKLKSKIILAHMCAQTLGGNRPLFYNKLVDCMDKVAEKAVLYHYEIHTVQFGAGLGGGNWEFIHELIEDCWNRRGIDTTIYHLN